MSEAKAKLSSRKRYDYRDIDTWELKLIRVGHAIWRLYKQENARNGGTVVESRALLEACETVWGIKREYRQELARRRSEQFKAWRGGKDKRKP